MNKKQLKPLITHPDDQNREQRAAFIKEQIYGSFTLLAVNIGLFIKPGLKIDSAIITIVSTTIGLWLASLLAAVLAFRVVNDKNMPRSDFIHDLAIHRGLLAAAVPSLLAYSIAAAEFIEVRTAVIAAIALAIISITIVIARSAKTRSNSLATAFISVGVQAAVGAVIILVKLGEK